MTYLQLIFTSLPCGFTLYVTCPVGLRSWMLYEVALPEVTFSLSILVLCTILPYYLKVGNGVLQSVSQ